MAECPFCGSKIKEEQLGCKNCGYNYRQEKKEEVIGEARELDSRVIPEEASYQNNNVPVDEGLSTLVKVVLVLATLFFSGLVGLIGGIVLLTSTKQSYKSFGLKLLILSIIMLGINIISGLIGGLFYTIGYVL